MNEPQEFQQQRIVDACTTLGEVIGRMIAFAVQLLERLVTATKAGAAVRDVDLLAEFNRSEAARFLSIGTTKLDEACNAELLGYHKEGKEKLFTRAELERYGKLHVRRWMELNRDA